MRRTDETKRMVNPCRKRVSGATVSLLVGACIVHATPALSQPTPAPDPDGERSTPGTVVQPTDNTAERATAEDIAVETTAEQATPEDTSEKAEQAAADGALQPAVETKPPNAPRSEPSSQAREPVAPKLVSKGSVKTPGAGAQQPMFGSFEGTYGLSGISTGFSFGPAGYYLGGELSVVRQFREFAWLGGYVDGVYDFGREQTRFSIGPEVGWSALGIDGGYLLAVDDVGTHSGVTVRPMLTMGFVSAFGRFSHLFEPSSSWLEAGLLVKYPLEF